MGMSKVNSEILENAVRDILAYSNGEKITHNGEERTGKKRKFTESVELQITIKNFDPTKDKRFSGTYRLPLPPKSSMKICVIANPSTSKCARRPVMMDSRSSHKTSSRRSRRKKPNSRGSRTSTTPSWLPIL